MLLLAPMRPNRIGVSSPSVPLTPATSARGFSVHDVTTTACRTGQRM